MLYASARLRPTNPLSSRAKLLHNERKFSDVLVAVDFFLLKHSKNLNSRRISRIVFRNVNLKILTHLNKNSDISINRVKFSINIKCVQLCILRTKIINIVARKTR